jgi:hypothetical protein
MHLQACCCIGALRVLYSCYVVKPQHTAASAAVAAMWLFGVGDVHSSCSAAASLSQVVVGVAAACWLQFAVDLMWPWGRCMWRSQAIGS